MDTILTGDFNDVVGESNNELTQLISDFGIINVHTNKHGFNTDIPTYKRRPRRLDYIFVSRRLLDHIKKCGYEKFDVRIVSDHRGYYADFSIKGLFDQQLPKLLSKMLRGIKGNNPVNIKKCIKFLFNFIGDHNIIRKANELAYSANFDEAKANKLDQIITEGILAAEKEYEQTYCLPWDEATHYTVTKLNILRCMILEERNTIDNKEVIEAKIKSLNDPEFKKTSEL